MTDEQIKQNALKAEKEHGHFNYQYQGEAFNNGYIAGAHSMLEEIEKLEKQLAAMTRLKNSFAGSVDILDKDNRELQEELDKLRNPWISVNERLPEESKKHKGWLSETVFVITNKDDGTSAKYDHATKTWCPAKILQGSITHWMPMPKSK